MGKDFFETFDSGSGPVIPDSAKSDMDHYDDGKGSYTSNAADDDQGSVPEVPKKSR